MRLSLVLAAILPLACSRSSSTATVTDAGAPITASSSSPPSSSPLAPSTETLRLIDLMDAADRYKGKAVDVVIVEPLRGPNTPERLAKSEYGQVEVDTPDGEKVTLVPKAWRAEDPNRYKKKFDHVIRGPIRVKGELLSDDELAKSTHRPAWVIRVDTIAPAPEEAPTRVEDADLPRLDRRRVIYEGVYTRGFEVSSVGKAWLGFTEDAVFVGQPSGKKENGHDVDRVRVTGTLFARPGHRYGHLGESSYLLVASKVEYLGG